MVVVVPGGELWSEQTKEVLKRAEQTVKKGSELEVIKMKRVA
jgi:hypothetical protein